MPNRVIREGILTSERINRLTTGAELAYRRLLSVIDDYGRYFAHPALLRAACFPMKLKDVSEKDVEKWIIEMRDEDLLVTYEVEGTSYLEVHNFGQHKRAMKSKFPGQEKQTQCDCTSNEQREARGACACAGEKRGERREAQESADAAPPPPVEAIVQAYREICVPAGLPDIRGMNEDRKRKTKLRTREETFRTSYPAIFKAMAESDFMRGQNDRGWVASFDWIIHNGENYLKVLEGKYANRDKAGIRNEAARKSELDAQIARARAELDAEEAAEKARPPLKPQAPRPAPQKMTIVRDGVV